jgi:hypothetical protein
MLLIKRFAIINLLLLAIALSTVAVVSSCATFEKYDVDTTRKAIVVANAEVRAANLLLQDLIKRNAISHSKATEVLGHLQETKDALQVALNAVSVAGDPVSGQTNVERANSALSLAILIMAPFVEQEN